ncbi:hypothetical protein MPSEU_000479700 [Mayamaea pseudoterrestris]|nr:hypothetical protein MPSEU_000479700 [Mayamaea pseudoterrestris]
MAPIAPINKKYLCAAPRPEQWNGYATNTLRNLGSSKEEREEKLRKTIEAARTMHADSIKAHIGPGRKSNAEHAIAFYEYLLDLVMQGWSEEDFAEIPLTEPKTKEWTPPAAAEAEIDEEQAHSSQQTRQLVHNNRCEVCDKVRNDKAIIVECSTCPRIFHAACHRPLKEHAVDGEWRCAYCILASEPKSTKTRRSSAAGVRLMARMRNQHLRQHNKETKGASKRGAASETSETDYIDTAEADEVLDAKLEAEVENIGRGDTEGKDECDTKGGAKNVHLVQGALILSDNAFTKVADTIEVSSEPFEDNIGGTVSKVSGCLPGARLDESAREASTTIDVPHAENIAATTSDNEDGKRAGIESLTQNEGYATPGTRRLKAELQQLMNPAKSGDADSGGRAKRARKQPALFDPQIVPARSWVSDEVQYLSSKEGLPPSQRTEAIEPSPENGNEVDLSPEAIAEIQRKRRAKAKREGGGDAIWCNFCLDSPDIPLCCFCGCRYCLLKHGQTKMLLCDTCNDEYHSFCLHPPAVRVASSVAWFCPQCKALRDRRMPRTTSKRTVVMTKGSDDAITVHPRRSASLRRNTGSAGSNDSLPEKRRPGRPRKHPMILQCTPATNAGKRIGRPFKKKLESHQKRNRIAQGENDLPRMGVSETDPVPAGDLGTSIVDDAIGIDVDAITTSRSGRTVRRSSFHDESELGEQHLRSFRDQQRRASTGIKETGNVGAVRWESITPTSVGAEAINYHESTVVTVALGGGAQTPADTPMQLNKMDKVAGDMTVSDTLIAAPYSRSSSFDGHGVAIDAVQHDRERAPRRKPGARECMQMSRRFGARIIDEAHMETLLDYCQRGKVEHLIRMRERLDDHARFLETQLAGLESAVQEKGESNIVVPAAPVSEETTGRTFLG